MKELKNILYNVKLTSSSGNMSEMISGITFDSRNVIPESLFVAVRGTQVDGHKFIDQAIKSGAICIVCETLPDELNDGVSYISTPDSSAALGVIADNYFDNPSSKLILVGVTGTNGKTSTCTLLHSLFTNLGFRVGLISTVKNLIHDEEILASHTTPDPISINALLSEMVEKGCSHAFMEVSSHAIDQNRITGLKFDGAVFMNITHDHLDYHGTFDNYIAAKKKLFDNLSANAFALINMDDKRGQVMLQNSKARHYTFGTKFASDYKARVIANSYQGLELDIDNQQVWFRLIGHFNAYNLLASYAVAQLLGENKQEVLMVLSGLRSAAGRFEVIDSNSDIIALVDYAHTPDALENVMKTVHELRKGSEKILTVVGCGGNRDQGKRPLMASIATKWSDKVIFTDDNPRDEDPKTIIDQMLKGVNKTNVKKTLVIQDRKEAIKTACSMASAKDIVLVVGKGHENYQEIKGERFSFDDKLVLKEMLNLFSI